MKAGSYDYLSKSSVSSPLAFKKSPGKYVLGESRAGDDPYNQLGGTSSSSGRKQWDSNEYKAVKKIPEEMSSLRQTFDVGSHSRFQQKLARYDLDSDETYKPRDKYENLMRSTFNGKISSPTSRDLTSSAVDDRTYKRDLYASYSDKNELVRSPISDKPSRRQDIQQKFKKYVSNTEQVKDLKNQLQTSSKMNEQLKRLKQERKKRLQAKQRQLNQLQKKFSKQDNTETFKKKDYYYQYTPKQPKSSYQDRFAKEKKMQPLDLSKYKSTDNSVANSALLKSKKDNIYGSQPKSALFSSSSYKLTQKPGASSSNSKMQLKDFILGKNLGEGKFGVVYQAIHKPTGWLFAIKKVPKDMIKSHLMIDQFILQLKLQTYLNHQNILTLFHSFDDRTSIYLVLEYMEEGTLFTHLKKNKTLPQKEVAVKIKQVASAVKYLHQNAIAHRDIKPENIVMSHSVCKLCDFGWSTVCDDRRKTYCGTFDYAPPQILQGVQYDQTVDIWCLGVLTYQLLVGKAPFYHISRKQTMKRILNVQKTNIEYPDNLSKTAVSFIQKLIKKDPNQRMSSEIILDHPFLRNVQDKK